MCSSQSVFTTSLSFFLLYQFSFSTQRPFRDKFPSVWVFTIFLFGISGDGKVLVGMPYFPHSKTGRIFVAHPCIIGYREEIGISLDGENSRPCFNERSFEKDDHLVFDRGKSMGTKRESNLSVLCREPRCIFCGYFLLRASRRVHLKGNRNEFFSLRQSDKW